MSEIETKGIPYHRDSFDLKGFAAYLADQGAVLLRPTNPYEVIRYQSFATVESQPGAIITKRQTNIVYRKDSGRLTYTGWSNKHYRDFQRGRALGQKPLNTPKKKRSGRPISEQKRTLTAKLLERDGSACWYCGLEMENGDITQEHLIPKSARGGRSLHNIVLAHLPCNQMAEDKPLAEKIALREELTKQAEDGRYEP